MAPLVAVAGLAARCYGQGLFSLQPGVIVRGAIVAAKGIGYSVMAAYRLVRALSMHVKNMWNGVASGSGIRRLVILLTNLCLSLTAVFANTAVLGGPPYLLWELLFANPPVLLPVGFVQTVRAIIDLAITIGTWFLVILILWFFIEEFTAGRNQVFELEDLQKQSNRGSTNAGTRNGTSGSDGRSVSPDQVESDLDAIEDSLQNKR